ncbi:hypothetical protein HDU67_006696 [Dinochytrium kinnereticum]|nr:hypothetical protein HDU67_006696 [Dinochytrium kinnereticum]
MGVSSASSQDEPIWQKIVGIVLALASGCLIGASVVFTKKGLITSRSNEPGNEHAYLRNAVWWVGMILTALGEVANFGAYAFAPAILVTPLGAISVVISAVLSTIFLKERLNFSGKVGCALCVIGATIIVLHAPASSSTQTIPEFFTYCFAPGFIVYSILSAALLGFLIFYLKPRYGEKTPLIYISISSIIGAYLVLSTSGFGASLVYSARNWTTDNQFKQWPIYPLFAFIIATIILQIHFLNRGLAIFSAAVVTPIYYVFFTTATLVSSAVLFRGFPVDSAAQGLSIVMGFMVIVGGVALLFQYSMQLLAAPAVVTNHSTASSIHHGVGGADGRPSKGAIGMSRSGSLASFETGGQVFGAGRRRASGVVGGVSEQTMTQLPDRSFAQGAAMGVDPNVSNCAVVDGGASVRSIGAPPPVKATVGENGLLTVDGRGSRLAMMMAGGGGSLKADRVSFCIQEDEEVGGNGFEFGGMRRRVGGGGGLDDDCRSVDAASFATVPGLPIFAAAAVSGPKGSGAGSLLDFEQTRSMSCSYVMECGRGCRHAAALLQHAQAMAGLQRCCHQHVSSHDGGGYPIMTEEGGLTHPITAVPSTATLVDDGGFMVSAPAAPSRVE